MASRKESRNDGSNDDSTDSGVMSGQKYEVKVKGQRGQKHKIKKMLNLSPPTSPSSTPEPVRRVSGSNISAIEDNKSEHRGLPEQTKWSDPVLRSPENIASTTHNPLQTKVSTSQSTPSHVHVTDQYKPVSQRGPDYNTLNDMHQDIGTLSPGQVYTKPQTVIVDSPLDQIQQIQPSKKHHYTQPLSHYIGSDTSQQFSSQMEQLAHDLAKVELERDRYKNEVEQKHQRLQEYETEIAQYRTKALYSGGRHSAVDHSHETRIKELEDSLTKHKRDLVDKDTKIKQLEDQLDNKKAEMEKERDAMKQSQDTKERELKQNMSKLKFEDLKTPK